MGTRSKWLAGAGLGLVVVAVVLGRIVLPPLIRPVVQQVAQSRDVDLEIGRVRIGVLTGRVGLDRLVVGNLPDFSAPNLATLDAAVVNARLLPLLGGELHVQSVALHAPVLHAERLESGRINVSELLDRLTGTPADDRTPGESSPSEPAARPAFRVARITIDDMQLRWTDRAVVGPAAEIAVEEADVTVRDLRSPMPAGEQATTFMAEGRLAGDPGGAFEARGRGNFVNDTMDFTMTAEFEDVGVAALGAYAARSPIVPTGGTVSGTVDATCEQNQLDAVARLQFRGLVLQRNSGSNLAFQVPAALFSQLGNLDPTREVTVKISGDIGNPRFNAGQAIMLAALTDIATASTNALGLATDVAESAVRGAGEVGKRAGDGAKDAVGSLVDKLPFGR